MSDWDDNSSSYQTESRGRGRGRGGGRGSFNRNHDSMPQEAGGDSWGNGNGGGEWGNNDDQEGGNSRGRGGGRGRGRGGSRFSDRNNDNENNGGEDGGDCEAPVSDKPRPTYIPPEINDDDLNSVEVGMNFNKYEKIEVKVKGDSVPEHIESFKSSGLREVLLEKLVKCNYTTPTPIQKYAIPVIISGRDMMASAQTGSGKTVSINLKILLT